MPSCKKCGTKFPFWITIDGKPRNLKNRRFCFDCSPFGKHNTVDLTQSVDSEYRYCPKCKETLKKEYFYRRCKGSRCSPYCKKCTNKHTTLRLRKNKQHWVELKGGKCQLCGYDKCLAAMEFHHITGKKDPHIKFGFGVTRVSAIMIEKELDKCILLCANCHREEHARIQEGESKWLEQNQK